jgi:hypothetical protein
MRTALIIALAAVLALCFASSCDFVKKNIKSIVKITVYDESNTPYGYVTVALVDSTGKVAAAEATNERGVVIFEGIDAGTYTASVRNAGQFECKVLKPDSISVTVGKTKTVDVIVERPPAMEQRTLD